MRVGYVTTYDPYDVSKWSGLGFYIGACLDQASDEVDRVGPLRPSFAAAGMNRVRTRIGLRGSGDRHPWAARGYARRVERQMSGHDVIVAPGTIPIAYVRKGIPVVFWTDATFGGIRDFYPEFTGLPSSVIRHGMEVEARALDRASLAIFSSEWAARTAIELHHADPAKVTVIPYGPTLTIDVSSERLGRILASRADAETLNVLFVGVDWWRKGGDIAFAAVELLNGWGIPARLDVVGCDVPMRSVPQWVTAHGFISKSSRQGTDTLMRLYEQSHFLLHPARAECCAVVFAEAAGYGVPIGAADVGGVATAVRTDVTGRLFEPADTAEAYAEWIAGVWSDRASYEVLANRTWEYARTRLDWQPAAVDLRAHLQRLAELGT